jgi:hypothetical protein
MQHFIPKFYLAGFTANGRLNGGFYVRTEGAGWQRSTPKREACEDDFYRVDMAGEDPNKYEDLLEGIETRAATVIRMIDEQHTLPVGKDFETLLAFVKALTARVPIARRLAERQVEGLLASAHTADHDRGISIGKRSRNRRGGQEPEHRDPALRRTLSVLLQFSGLRKSVAKLALREWSLVVGDDSAGAFVTSDRPVVVSWEASYRSLQPSLLSRGSRVSCPLTKHVALLGHFGMDPPFIVQADADLVAFLNSLTATAPGVRHVYSPTPGFAPWHDPSFIAQPSILVSAEATTNRRALPSIEFLLE